MAKMFKRKHRVESPVAPSNTARKRAASLSTSELELAMESVLNSALPETFDQWRNGNAPDTEMANTFQATVAIWDELVKRTRKSDW